MDSLTVYHVTPFADSILKSGFNLDKQGTMFGAGDSGGYISTTPSLENARMYCGWMSFLREVAFKRQDIFGAMRRAEKLGATSQLVADVVRTSTHVAGVRPADDYADAIVSIHRGENWTGDQMNPISDRDMEKLTKQFVNSLAIASRGQYAAVYIGSLDTLQQAPEPCILEVQANGHPLKIVAAEQEYRYSPEQLTPLEITQ